MKPTKVLLYTNNYLYYHLDNPEITEAIREESNVTEWVTFDNDVEKLPTEIANNQELIGVFNGISFQHYKKVQKGGVFMNAMLIGIMYDKEAWSKIITKDEATMAYYIPIPYEVYERVVDESKKVSREKYTEMDEAMQKAIAALNVTETTTKH